MGMAVHVDIIELHITAEPGPGILIFECFTYRLTLWEDRWSQGWGGCACARVRLFVCRRVHTEVRYVGGTKSRGKSAGGRQGYGARKKTNVSDR